MFNELSIMKRGTTQKAQGVMITAARRIVLAITEKCSERKGHSYAGVVTAEAVGVFVRAALP